MPIRRKKNDKPPGEMPEELQRFRFHDWHDPEDIASFEPQGKGTDLEEQRAVHLMARAKRRWSDARYRWRYEHGEIEELPISMLPPKQR